MKQPECRPGACELQINFASRLSYFTKYFLYGVFYYPDNFVCTTKFSLETAKFFNALKVLVNFSIEIFLFLTSVSSWATLFCGRS